MAQSDKNLDYKVPPFLDKTENTEMTVKRYWSRFNAYFIISHQIGIEPLLEKQKTAVENKKEVYNDDDKNNLQLALENLKWVTGQETEKCLIIANPKQKVHALSLCEYKILWEKE